MVICEAYSTSCTRIAGRGCRRRSSSRRTNRLGSIAFIPHTRSSTRHYRFPSFRACGKPVNLSPRRQSSRSAIRPSTTADPPTNAIPRRSRTPSATERMAARPDLPSDRPPKTSRPRTAFNTTDQRSDQIWIFDNLTDLFFATLQSDRSTTGHLCGRMAPRRIRVRLAILQYSGVDATTSRNV